LVPSVKDSVNVDPLSADVAAGTVAPARLNTATSATVRTKPLPTVCVWDGIALPFELFTISMSGFSCRVYSFFWTSEAMVESIRTGFSEKTWRSLSLSAGSLERSQAAPKPTWSPDGQTIALTPGLRRSRSRRPRRVVSQAAGSTVGTAGCWCSS
jgi:hypothetical protein